MTRFPDLAVGTKMADLVPKLLECMNDKDSAVRASADAVVALVIAKKGCKKQDWEGGMDGLSASVRRTTQVRQGARGLAGRLAGTQVSWHAVWLAA